MIARGYNIGKLRIYLVRKPRFELISIKEALKEHYNLIRARFNLIAILLSLPKEKSLYNTAFTDNIIGGVV